MDWIAPKRDGNDSVPRAQPKARNSLDCAYEGWKRSENEVPQFAFIEVIL